MPGLWSWGGLLWVTMLSSEWASMALLGVSAAVRLLVCPPPGSPPWGSWRPSGGLPGNHSNFPAHSGWAGRQVHLVNWFQDTGIGQKVNGQQVRLLLWTSSWLCLPKRTELPLVFQPGSLVFSQHSPWDKKDRACQNRGNVFTSSMSFQTSKKSHRTKVKTGGAWLLRDNWGERRLTLHFFQRSLEVPGTWLVYTLGGSTDHSDGLLVLTEGMCDPRRGSGDCVSLTPPACVSSTCTGRRHTHKAKKKGRMHERFSCVEEFTLYSVHFVQACACLPLYPHEVHPPSEDSSGVSTW